MHYADKKIAFSRGNQHWTTKDEKLVDIADNLC